MFSAAARSSQTEWMDAAHTDPADLAACLHDLAAVNTMTLARPPTVGFMRRACRRAHGRPVSVLDVGCGDGDMLRRLHRWAARTGHPLNLAGADLNPAAIQAAHAATPPALGIAFHHADAFDPALGGYDVIISSLLTHHLSDAEIVRFLTAMEARAGLGWFVNDLHRNRLAFHGFRALSAAAGWHPMVRHDGPISVARAFRAAEWHKLLRRAGLDDVAELRWRLPFRYCVARLK